MIVYHGSDIVVENPDVLHSYRPLDFGKGFYVTSVREQAVRHLVVQSHDAVLHARLHVADERVRAIDIVRLPDLQPVAFARTAVLPVVGAHVIHGEKIEIQAGIDGGLVLYRRRLAIHGKRHLAVRRNLG